MSRHLQRDGDHHPLFPNLRFTQREGATSSEAPWIARVNDRLLTRSSLGVGIHRVVLPGAELS